MRKSRVAVANEADMEKMIPSVLDLPGDLSGIFEGKRAAVKPNDTRALAGDLTACTPF